MKIETSFININNLSNIVGPLNENLKVIEDFFNVKMDFDGYYLTLSDTENKNSILNVLRLLNDLSNKGIKYSKRDLIYITKNIDNYDKLYEFYMGRKTFFLCANLKPISAKTINQQLYLNYLENYPITIAIGPAGTGKTYLAVMFAAKMLKENKIKKIILTRPVVEAGEELGFLPGDLKEKVDPYLRPLYDALYEALGFEQTNLLIDKQIIEIAPLAYMRGRTLDNALVILDEAQNTTNSQMKMFLTRLGFNSKMVITGDISQIDLPKKSLSGLITIQNILQHIDDIKFIEFDNIDQVRHPLVSKILERYDEHEN